jgi:histidine kinase
MKKPKNQQEKDKETTKSSATKLIKEIARVEGIISAIGDGISILDTTFTIVYENKLHRDLMGAHVGEKCYKAYQKRQDICSGCPVAPTFKDGKVHTVQREVQTDSETRYFEITASPLKDPTEKIIAGIEVVSDITERKKMEKKNSILLSG